MVKAKLNRQNHTKKHRHTHTVIKGKNNKTKQNKTKQKY